jgi:hypothetical protein
MSIINIESSHGNDKKLSWFRLVKRVVDNDEESLDSKIKGHRTYSFKGYYLYDGENKVPDRSVIIEVYPEGKKKHPTWYAIIYKVIDGVLVDMYNKQFLWDEEFDLIKEHVKMVLKD